MNRRADQHNGADRRKLAKRNLEAEREEQQRDAEFRKLLDPFNVPDGKATSEGADDNAGNDVSDD